MISTRGIRGAAIARIATAIVVLIATGSVVPSTVTATTPPASSMYIDLDPQGGGNVITLPPGADWHTRSTSDTTTITGQVLPVGGPPQGFVVSDDRWAVHFYNQAGPVTAGTFDVPMPAEEISCGPICASVSAVSNQTDCWGSGPFTIHDIAFAADGSLASVNADFRMLCFGLVIAGSIRYHSLADTNALDQSVDAIAFPNETIGSSSPSQMVTFTNIGTVTATFGHVIFDGYDKDFLITSDSCSSKHLAVGAACAVGVKFLPTDSGYRNTNLRIPDGTSRGSRLVRLLAAGFRPTTLTFELTELPVFGPGSATFVMTVTPPSGTPPLFIDGVQKFGPTEVILSNPMREVFTYRTTVGAGHHVATTSLDTSGFFLGATADPITFDVGTGTTLTLSATTDDGVAVGESATLLAQVAGGASLIGGTIRIRDGATDSILTSATVSASSSSISYTLTPSAGTHRFIADYVPASADAQGATTQYDLIVVAGSRPDTLMDSSTLFSSSGQTVLSGFSSPDPGVSFDCRVDVSNWFICTDPVVVHANGPTHTLSVRAVASNGLADRTPATRDWIVDQIAPTASAPTVQAATTGSALTNGLVPVRASWTGSDATSGIDHYAVYLSTDGGLWTSIDPSVPSTTVVRDLASGHRYRFGIQPVDRAGNVGTTYGGSTFRLTGVSQSNPAVHYHGTWASSTSTTWWGGTARSSSIRASTASYTFTGRSVAWVGLKASNRGKAYVYVNGILKATVDLYSATTLKQRVVWAANYSTTATRTITIKVLGTSGRPRVDIDGFIVGS